MLVPNAERVIVKRFSNEDIQSAILLQPGQLKAGENLFVGEIVHGGNTKFNVGQIVYYSEYSASAIVDLSEVLKKKESLAEAAKNKTLFVVAEDDIMAYESNENDAK